MLSPLVRGHDGDLGLLDALTAGLLILCDIFLIVHYFQRLYFFRAQTDVFDFQASFLYHMSAFFMVLMVISRRWVGWMSHLAFLFFLFNFWIALAGTCQTGTSRSHEFFQTGFFGSSVPDILSCVRILAHKYHSS